MGQLVRLAEFRRKSAALHFTRAELNQLLGVYSSRVIKGEWRDYSIGTTPGFARFCIYRSSREEPVFTITKLATEGRAKSPLARKGRFVVTSQQRTLSQSNSLLEALQIFKQPIKLVSH
jgi:hypothetical protein